MTFRPLAALGLAAVLAACTPTTTRVAVTAPAFDAAAAERALRPGRGSIEGEAFLTRPTGGVVRGSGATVRLIPATPYAVARFEALYGPAKFRPASALREADTTDPDYARLTRTAKANASGKFTFENVAPGDYYLVTSITYLAKEGDLSRSGGAIYERVTVRGEDATEAVLSGT